MRILCTLLLLLVSYVAAAQNFSFEKAIAEVDSLVEYNRYTLADKKADSLLLLAEGWKKEALAEEKLRLLLLKAKMYEKKEDNDKALKLLLDVSGQASSGKFYKILCRAYIIMALIYEKQQNVLLHEQYLNAADNIRKEHGLEELYSSILIRRSLQQIFFRNNIDSAIYYIRQAKMYAEKYNNAYDVAASTLMMGTYSAREEEYPKAVTYYGTSVRYFLKTNNYNDALFMYYNIAELYKLMGQMNEVWLYCDSAYALLPEVSTKHKHIITKYKYGLFEETGNIDSALFYLKKAYDLRDTIALKDEIARINEIAEQYESDKKEAVIESKNRQILLVISLLLVIVIAAVLLLRSNRKINVQNKIISKQVEELMRTVNQKQMLLSELQHRVKNNLQHVISILEIQKESADFNNIDELIRGNQNRIHSMALLHKKLNMSENVNEVELKRYVTELAELVKDSYDSRRKQVGLGINCEIEKMSIEKALPLGLIIVELVSNSMKHAFKNRTTGRIHIEVAQDSGGRNRLYYTDNGKGFDFKGIVSKGLGLEIIKGLIDQLDGRLETGNKEGFELLVLF